MKCSKRKDLARIYMRTIGLPFLLQITRRDGEEPDEYLRITFLGRIKHIIDVSRRTFQPVRTPGDTPLDGECGIRAAATLPSLGRWCRNFTCCYATSSHVRRACARDYGNVDAFPPHRYRPWRALRIASDEIDATAIRRGIASRASHFRR